MKERKHWLYRPENIRKLWYLGFAILGASVLAQLVFEVHGHFGMDEWFGFNAVYGFLTCTGMVLFAKLLGLFVKRDDIYYEDVREKKGGEP